MVENLSWFTGDDGTRYELFGAGGGQELADDLEVPLLGQVPLVPPLRVGGDTGVPVRVADPAGEAALAFDALATRVEELGPARICTSASSTYGERVHASGQPGAIPTEVRTRRYPWRSGRSSPPRRRPASNTAR